MRGAVQFRFRHAGARTARRWTRYAIGIAAIVAVPPLLTNYPPGIEIKGPVDGQAILADSLTVGGIVANDRIATVWLTTNNDAPQAVAVSDHKFSAPAALHPGRNYIQVSPGGIAANFVPGTRMVKVLRPVPGKGAAVAVPILALRGFDVKYGDPPEPGQTFGIVGGGCYYRGKVSIVPLLTAPQDGTVHVGFDDRTKVQDVQKNEVCGLGSMIFGMTLMDLNATGCITRMTAEFDRGPAIAGAAGSSGWLLVIPPGATRLIHLEIVWEWQNNRRALSF